MKKKKKKKQPGAATFVSREDIYSWLTLTEKLKVGSDRMPSTVDMMALLTQGMPPCLLYPTRRALSSLGPHQGACTLGCPGICKQHPEVCLSVGMMVASQRSVVVSRALSDGLPLGLRRNLQARKTAVQKVLVTTVQLQRGYHCRCAQLPVQNLGFMNAM